MGASRNDALFAVLFASLVAPLARPTFAAQEWFKQLPPYEETPCGSCACLSSWGLTTETCLPEPVSYERYWGNGFNALTSGDLVSTVPGLVPGATYLVGLYAFRSDLDAGKDMPYQNGNGEAEYVSKFILRSPNNPSWSQNFGYCEPLGTPFACDWFKCGEVTYTVPQGDDSVEVITAVVGGSHDCDCLYSAALDEIHSCGAQGSVTATTGNSLQYIAMGHKVTFERVP